MTITKILLGLFITAWIVGVIANTFFGTVGVMLVFGLWMGFFLGIIVKNYLFEKSTQIALDDYYLLN